MQISGCILLTVIALTGSADFAISQSPTSNLVEAIRHAELQSQDSANAQSSVAWYTLAHLYQDAARYQDAERAYSKAITLLQPGNRTALADATDSLGTLYVEVGQYAKAEPLERQALAIREQQNDSLGAGRSWMHLAMLSLGKHDNAEAARYAELAADSLVPERGSNHAIPGATLEEKMTALINLSLVRCAQGASPAALPELHLARTFADTSHEASSFPSAFLDFLEGYALWKSDDFKAAAQLMKKGTEGMEAQLGLNHPTCIASLRQYESFLKQTGQTMEASVIETRLKRAQTRQTLPQLARAASSNEQTINNR
jgi:tetratricopeptide (TPR) repeat protein